MGQETYTLFIRTMTMTSNEDTIRDNPPNYLDLAEFIQNYANIDENLEQLYGEGLCFILPFLIPMTTCAIMVLF
jgi:hypothetical protein